MTDVIYVETWNSRYELSLIDPSAPASSASPTQASSQRASPSFRYSWCKVLSPQSMDTDTLYKKWSVPLASPSPSCQVIHQDLNWAEFQWGQNSLNIRGMNYPILKISFKKRTVPIVLPQQEQQQPQQIHSLDLDRQ